MVALATTAPPKPTRSAGPTAIAAAASPDGFAERLDAVPVLLAVLVDLGALAAVDRDLDRYTFAGAASVYPFAWNLLLAARDEGLGGVITTMAIRAESEVLDALGAPDGYAVAAVLALGHPTRTFTKLTRRVAFTTSTASTTRSGERAARATPTVPANGRPAAPRQEDVGEADG